jgi:hypothetical protein
MAKQDEPRLKIARPTFEDLKVKVNTEVGQGVRQYMEFFQSKTGTKVSLDETVNGMLEDFLANDKAFQKFARSGRGAGSKPSASATAGGAGGAGGG